MGLREASILGLIQGISEFAPVSSSAHLALARQMLGLDALPRAFDIALHAGSAAALLIATGPELARLSRALAADLLRHDRVYSVESRHALRLALATAPAICAGAVVHPWIAAHGNRPGSVAFCLAVGAVLLAAAEARGTRRGNVARTEVTDTDALLIGLAQAVALLPGVSRSGATIAAARARGLDRPTASHFSLLLAAPVTLAAVARTVPDWPHLRDQVPASTLALSATLSLLASAVGMQLLGRFTRRAGMLPFAPYRLTLAYAVYRCERHG